jgi:hypothetical protein
VIERIFLFFSFYSGYGFFFDDLTAEGAEGIEEEKREDRNE